MTLAMAASADPSFPPTGKIWRCFVGSVSPRGHMLRMLTCAAHLVNAALGADAPVIIYDTTGLMDPAQGGANLKMAKIDLLRPAVLCAIQRDLELERFLIPLRRSRRVQVIDLPSFSNAQNRDILLRRAHRTRQFASYFSDANLLRVRWVEFAVFPAPRFEVDHLVAMEDRDGLTLGLGIVLEVERGSKSVTLLTPLTSMRGVNAIRLGDMMVDPETYEDQQLTPRR
jgi:polynucleotide 5'-kinase involved in rRNA processing